MVGLGVTRCLGFGPSGTMGTLTSCLGLRVLVGQAKSTHPALRIYLYGTSYPRKAAYEGLGTRRDPGMPICDCDDSIGSRSGLPRKAFGVIETPRPAFSSCSLHRKWRHIPQRLQASCHVPRQNAIPIESYAKNMQDIRLSSAVHHPTQILLSPARNMSRN